MLMISNGFMAFHSDKAFHLVNIWFAFFFRSGGWDGVEGGGLRSPNY